GHDRLWRLDAQRPVDLGQVVDAEVRHLAAGVVVEPPEAVERPVLVVRLLRGRPEPRVPVEVPGRFLVGRVADPPGPLILDVEAAHGRHRADAALADDLGRLLAERARQPLDADLYDALVLAGRLDHRPPLGDAQRQRLLAVDVL